MDNCESSGSGLPLKSHSAEMPTLPLDASITLENLETYTALCQFNNNQTSEESISSTVDKQRSLSQSKKRLTDEELDECISCLENLMNKTLQEKNELKKLKTRKRSRIAYKQKNDEKKAERIKQIQETRCLESEVQKEKRRENERTQKEVARQRE